MLLWGDADNLGSVENGGSSFQRPCKEKKEVSTKGRKWQLVRVDVMLADTSPFSSNPASGMKGALRGAEHAVHVL